MQYVMAIHIFNKSFMYFLMTQNTLLFNQTSLAQYFILNHYAKIVFQDIMPNISITKVSTAEKSQFKVYNMRYRKSS